MARKKVTSVPALADWGAVDNALRDIRECQHTLAEMAVQRDRQIDSIKDNSASFLPGEGKQDPDKKIWQDDVDACNAATEIIKKLCEENCFSVAEAISYIAQSKKLLQDWGNLHAKYEVPSQPVKNDGVWHCPDCNHRVNPHHSHCHWCGTRLLGGALK